MSNPLKQRSGTFRADVAVDPNTSYVFSAWFRSRNILPNFPTAIRETYHSHSPFKVDVEQLAGGKVLSTASAWGYTGTADWNRQFTGVRTRRDVTALRIVGRRKGCLVFACANPTVLRLFAVTGMDQTFELAHSREAALEIARASAVS